MKTFGHHQDYQEGQGPSDYLDDLAYLYGDCQFC